MPESLPHPGELSILKDDVHVWWARLDLTTDQVVALGKLLSEDERTRAHRFVRDRDRVRFTVSHGLLRCILSGYSGTPPAALNLAAEDQGKPYLVNESGDRDRLEFSLAHSGNLGLYGIALGRRVGVDVELIDKSFPFEAVAARFFTALECERIHTTETAEKRHAFYTCWTRKEAYAKACGIGLPAVLARPGVSFAPVACGQPQVIEGYPSDGDRWVVYGVPAEEGVVAALVAEGRPCTLITRRVPG
ncbi:MAG: 4'-phosphopantetheinyl transferase superfamily protein [Chloroflexi bacterium]|nr:4'-phosphopantetheinyl transferase superfamily protein [Chloroflexota bacterium]